MRGYAEESPEVTARRRLTAAARKYAGRYLAFDLIAREIDEAEEQLVAAALALAEARCPKRARPGGGK